MAVYSCRYPRLVAVLAAMDGSYEPAVPDCDLPAAYATQLIVFRDGQEAELFTRQCEYHDGLCHPLNEYRRSVALTTPQPDPS